MDRRIVLLGATGRTGRLVAGELVGQPSVLLVARDRARLGEVGRATGLATAAADLRDLAGVLLPGDVLLTCVGPYDQHGDTVVEAAIAARATYVDVTGEPAFLRRLHTRHDAAAAAANICLLPAAGYEFLPGHLVAGAALADAGPGASRVEIAYLADGGLQAGSAGGRRSLVAALGKPTTTFRGGRHVDERFGSRRGRFTAGGRSRDTVAIGGAEVWSLPAAHPRLRSVDVHSGWFGAASAGMGIVARAAGLARAVGLDRILDSAVGLLGDGPEGALASGTSRFVARVRDRRGRLLARREAVAGNPIVLAARLSAAVAMELSATELDDLPAGTTDPLRLLGLGELERLAGWAGLVLTDGGR